MTPSAHLIADFLRRRRLFLLFGALQLAIIWALPAISGDTPAALSVLAMVIVLALGPGMAIGTMARREILVRPLSVGDRWVALAVCAVVIVPLWLALARLMPIVLLRPISRLPLSEAIGTLAQATVIEMTACAAWLGVYAILPRARLTTSHHASPHRSVTDNTGWRRGFVGSLSGFRIIAWTYGLALICSLLVLFTALMIASWIEVPGAGVLSLPSLGLSALFDAPSGLRFDRDIIRQGVLVPLASFHPALFLARRLRTMPFSARQVTVLFMTGPTIASASAWLGCMLAYRAAIGAWPEESRLPLFALTAAGGGLLSVLQLRVNSRGQFGKFAIVPAFIFTGKIIDRLDRAFVPAGIAVIASVLFAIAIALHYISLTRRNDSFRPLPPPPPDLKTFFFGGSTTTGLR